ncbi:hypothetical protein ACRAR1_16650 [Streptomyces sanyensis]|uniref:hypothetical protein n=1 Tax=Streptomyces sanyensis TaxID=568869 RepID=UPI003D77550A
MAATLTFTWTVQGAGWARISAEDEYEGVDTTASYCAGTDAAAHFLYALVRLILTDTRTTAEFHAEPEVYRWFFSRDGPEVDITVVMADGYQAPADSGVVLWSSRQPLDVLCRAVVRAFDGVLHELGEEGYQREWRRSFPRPELEGLRAAWRGLRAGAEGVQRGGPR